MIINSNTTGVISIGVKTPIIRQGDDLVKIITESVLSAVNNEIENGDVIGITESIVARNQGNYATIDDIVNDLGRLGISKDEIVLLEPIMSRNRFSIILRAFARYTNKITVVHRSNFDQQGNPTNVPNPFTGVNVSDYYKQICEEENCKYKHIIEYYEEYWLDDDNDRVVTCIDARCHTDKPIPGAFITLADIMAYPNDSLGYNEDWGLLGSNKADDETLKLFPRKEESQQLVEKIQGEILKRTSKHIEVMVYGDGCFHSPEISGILGSSINEFADPVTSPAYTSGLEGTPNEIKIKAFADGKYKHLNGDELNDAIKEEIRNNKEKSLVGNMTSQGTTPRKYTDLLASLMDLTTGSGGKGTPVTIIRNYFKTFAD